MRIHQAILLTLFCLVSALLCCGCGGEQESPSTPSASISGGVEETNTEGGSSAIKPSDPLRPVVVVETSLGQFEIQLDAKAAPGTVNNFLHYTNNRLYDGTIFHYANKQSMILGGELTPSGERMNAGSPIRNEAFNGLKNVRGSVAINRHPDLIDSATCQFFVNVRDNPKFDYHPAKRNNSETGGNTLPQVSAEDYGYCVFGRVTSGMDVVDKIAAQATHTKGEQKGSPVVPVKIRSIRLAGQSPESFTFGGIGFQR